MLTFAKSIVETVRHPLLVLDAQGAVVAANPAFYDAFVVAAEEVLGRSFFELNDGAWDSQQLRTLLQDVITNDGEFEDFQIDRVIPAPGRRIEVLSARRVTRDRDITPMVLLSIEVRTDGREDQFSLQRLNVDLEGRVSERANESLIAQQNLQHTVLELAAVNRELEAFCYSVSHDLRTPLRAIDGFSAELLDSYVDKLDERGKHYLQRIRAGTQRMGLLIDDLLKLSRATRTEMNREQVDLTALAESIVEELRENERDRKVMFTAQPGISANCDPDLARVALENLLSNAWKFTSKKPTSKIEFGTCEYNELQAFVVRDDGAGFDPTYKAKLFGAFQRLHSDREFPGTGVGLATVQRIVRRHGGEIWAEGVVGGGAAFYFTIAEGARK